MRTVRTAPRRDEGEIRSAANANERATAAPHTVAHQATEEPLILRRALSEAVAAGRPYAGSVTPREAWSLVQEGEAVLVDVRSAEERKFVGHVPESVHVPWATGLSRTRNPRFVRELEVKGGKGRPLLLLCCSGWYGRALRAETCQTRFESPLRPFGKAGTFGFTIGCKRSISAVFEPKVLAINIFSSRASPRPAGV